jgi:hypothetical protein
MNWIDFKKVKPKHGAIVLVHFLDGDWPVPITIAMYIAPRTEKADDFLNEDTLPEFFDHDEKTDIDWTPAGFYEFRHADEANYFLNRPVTHWMHLPDSPKAVNNE